MSRPCSVCRHAERAAIDARLADGDSARGLAPQYGLSHDAIGRHRRHLQPAGPAAGPVGPDPLAELVEHLRQRVPGGDPSVIREYRLALAAVRAAGDAAPAIDFTTTKEWRTARRVLLDALRGHPQARRAVAKALLDIDPEDGA